MQSHRSSNPLIFKNVLEIHLCTNVMHQISQVSSADISGGVLLQSPFLRDFDQREIFCMHLYPGNSQNWKVCLHSFALYFLLILILKYLYVLYYIYQDLILVYVLVIVVGFVATCK